MRIEELVGDFFKLEFPTKHDKEHPDQASLAEMRGKLARLIQDEEFISECIALELARFRQGQLSWGLMPFYIVPDLGIRIAFGYWPPGGSPGPHEHTAWTITGVWNNKLEVFTYDRLQSYRQGCLISKMHFDAHSGEVGYVAEPCIHAPRNPTQDWSLSLHVMSPLDGQPIFDLGRPLACLSRPGSERPFENHPYAYVVQRRSLHAFVYQLARVLAKMSVPRAAELLIECAFLGGPRARQFVSRNASKSTNDCVPRLLRRVNPDLVLSYFEDNGIVALRAETPRGHIEEFELDGVWTKVVAFIAGTGSFEVAALPGDLSEYEKQEIAASLEVSGLFTSGDQ